MSVDNTDRFIIDKKFYNSNYIASRSDIESMLSIQKAELYHIVRSDLDDIDDLRNYDKDSNIWTQEQETIWFELHKRYIITRKLLFESGYVVFNAIDYPELRAGTNVNSLSLDDLNILCMKASDAFRYSSKYDDIKSDVWNNEYQVEYDYVRMTYEALLNELALRNK